MTIYSNVSELVGRTPLIRLNKASERTGAEIIAKLEAAQSAKPAAAPPGAQPPAAVSPAAPAPITMTSFWITN